MLVLQFVQARAKVGSDRTVEPGLTLTPSSPSSSEKQREIVSTCRGHNKQFSLISFQSSTQPSVPQTCFSDTTLQCRQYREWNPQQQFSVSSSRFVQSRGLYHEQQYEEEARNLRGPGTLIQGELLGRPQGLPHLVHLPQAGQVGEWVHLSGQEDELDRQPDRAPRDGAQHGLPGEGGSVRAQVLPGRGFQENLRDAPGLCYSGPRNAFSYTGW